MANRYIIPLIQASLTSELLNKEQRSKLTGIHPVEGHCCIAAEAAYHLLGGKSKGWKPIVIPRKVIGNNTHWFLRHERTSEIVDPTAEQFGDETIPYHLGVPCGFMCPKKRQA